MKEGSGDAWICFPGYGQGSRTILRFVEQIFPKDTIIGVDLPAHGGTELSDLHLSLDDVTYLVGKLARLAGVDRVNLFGFSMGGALALKAVELCPGQVKGALLIAPDGLKRYPMRWFATSTSLGTSLFRRSMNNPASLFRIMDLAVKLKFMDKSVVDFFKFQLRDEEQRDRVYGSWNAFKFLQPDLVDIRKKLFRYKIELRMVFGNHDKVIVPTLANTLSGNYVKHAKVHFLARGHDLIKNEVAEEIKSIIEDEL